MNKFRESLSLIMMLGAVAALILIGVDEQSAEGFEVARVAAAFVFATLITLALGWVVLAADASERSED